MDDNQKLEEELPIRPQIHISLRPIAPPSALGLAGFSGSTFIVASNIAGWYGNTESTNFTFPFIFFFGGLAQFVAGIHGFYARDTLALVMHSMWGSFWMGIGTLYAFTAVGIVAPHSIHTHYPELASVFIVMTLFTWSGALAGAARDMILTGQLVSLAVGSTIACCLYSRNGEHGGVGKGMKAAAYFWLLSAFFGWFRVTAFLVEEAWGEKHPIARMFAVGRVDRAMGVVSGVGEPGVGRGGRSGRANVSSGALGKGGGFDCAF